jgi:uncharacterized protein DUF2846
VFVPTAPPGPQQALIYVYRDADRFGQLVPVRIRVNGEEIGRLPNNAYSSSYALAGAIMIDATPWQDFAFDERRRVTLSGEVAKGETYFLRVHQEQTGPVVKIYLKVVTADEGNKALVGLRHEVRK